MRAPGEVGGIVDKKHIVEAAHPAPPGRSGRCRVCLGATAWPVCGSAPRSLLGRNRADDRLRALRIVHRPSGELQRGIDQGPDIWSVQIVG